MRATQWTLFANQKRFIQKCSQVLSRRAAEVVAKHFPLRSDHFMGKKPILAPFCRGMDGLWMELLRLERTFL